MTPDETRKLYERRPETEFRKLTIAIDFDDTYTASPVMWKSLIQLMRLLGHVVICVSSRKRNVENMEQICSELGSSIDDVLLAYDTPKREFARLSNYSVDIWIDDRPETIATKEEMLRHVG